MGTTTTTFALNKPTVGGDDNAWGTDWNTNADKLDDLLDGTTAIKPNLSEGLWKVGGVAVTATAAELNILDGVTATTAELNHVDGVTSAIQTQLDGKQALDADLTAIAGLASNGIIARTGAGTAAARTVTAGTGITVTNGDGVSGDPTVAATLASQAEAQAGTDNTKLMTPLRVADAITALVPAGFGQGQSWQSVSRVASTSYQNTTGKPIMVLFWLATNTSGTIRNTIVEASVNNSTWVTVGGVSGSGSDAPQCVSIVIPPNHYYRWVWVSSPANASVAAAELR